MKPDCKEKQTIDHNRFLPEEISRKASGMRLYVAYFKINMNNNLTISDKKVTAVFYTK